jgi:hypothetical protein
MSILYRLDKGDRCVGLFPSLQSCVAHARKAGVEVDFDLSIWRMHGDANGCYLTADPVAEDEYATREPVTRADAEKWIDERDARIGPDPTGLARYLGFARCDAHDPREKQITDFLESAGLVWRDLADADAR